MKLLLSILTLKNVVLTQSTQSTFGGSYTPGLLPCYNYIDCINYYITKYDLNENLQKCDYDTMTWYTQKEYSCLGNTPMGQYVNTEVEEEDRRDTIIAVSMVAGFAVMCVSGVALYFCWQAKKARREESLEY